MSKTSLRKTLNVLDRSQLYDLILELYEARKEARDYLDFFANPDIGKRMEKARTNIAKEFMRSSRGRNKTRITHINKYIKDISSLNAGIEYEIELLTHAIEMACKSANENIMKESVQNGVARYILTNAELALRFGTFDEVYSRMENAVGKIRSSLFSRNKFKTALKDALDESKARADINRQGAN